MGDERPCDGPCDCRLEILGEPTATSKPCDCSLDDPTARQGLEAFFRARAFDDFDTPLTYVLYRGAQFSACIAAIGENVTQPRIQKADRGQHERSAIAVLHIGRVRDKPDGMALRVGDDVTFTALDLSAMLTLSLLPASNPRGPPLSVVFTDWLSITPALGLGSRPGRSRAAITSR
jgi:hypothetical protein